MSFLSSFWNEDIWLPPNVTWSTFKDDERFNQFSHLYLPIPAAFVVIGIRMVIQRNIFRPLGLFLGLKHSVTKNDTIAHDDDIHKAVLAGATGTADIAKKAGVGEREVERWKRRKRNNISTLGRSVITDSILLIPYLQTSFVRLDGDGPSTCLSTSWASSSCGRSPGPGTCCTVGMTIRTTTWMGASGFTTWWSCLSIGHCSSLSSLMSKERLEPSHKDC